MLDSAIQSEVNDAREHIIDLFRTRGYLPRAESLELVIDWISE
jgi:hypothetical protein